MKTKLTLFANVIAVALFGTGCVSTEPAFVSDGLVAYYPFNGNVLDESGNGNHGTVKANLDLVEDRFGSKDKAYSFDRGHIQVENNPTLQMSDALTISAWIKNPGGNPTVLSKWFQDRRTWSYGLYVGTVYGGGFGFYLNDGQRNFMELRGWKIKEKEQWNHVVATYDGQHAKIYLNGKMEAIGKTGNEKIHVNDNPVTIGTDGYSNHYTGEMDDIRIYNRALSADEVKALYDLEKPKTK